MKLYHYATWKGDSIHKQKVIKPSNRYYNYIDWKLVFLTRNEYWDPSIQSYSIEGYYEKCGSSPQVYTELGIPCWKFEVRVPWARLFPHYIILTTRWKMMIADAIHLGSDVTEWHITSLRTDIIKSWKWKGDKYEKVTPAPTNHRDIQAKQ